MTSPNSQQPSLEHSRVSSSSSSSSQNYEILPRQQPFIHLSRDAASPRASFPFKRVQAGFQSMSIKNQNDSQISARESNKKIEQQSKQLIQAIGQINTSTKIIKNMENQTYQMGKQIQHEQCNSHIRELQQKISKLQQKLSLERNDFELQKRANQIYSEGFGHIRELISKQTKLEGESIQELVQKLNELLKVRGSREQDQRANGDSLLLIEQQDQKIRQLRAQLVKSSQNNINAIFNTQITEAHCLHLQIKKLNNEIMTLKDSLFKLNQENNFQVTHLMQNTATHKQPKVINIYHHNSLDSSGDQDVLRKEISKGKRKKSQLNKSGRERLESSESESNKKSRRLSNTQVKVGELVQGYKNLRQQYKTLETTIKQLNNNQSQYKTFFTSLKTEISTSLSNQIKQVKETIRRPSSNSEEKKFAKDLESKLNHLINTLNAPEKASAERSSEEDGPSNWQKVESMKRISQLESSNTRLQNQIKILEQDNEGLQQKIIKMSHFESPKSKRTGKMDLQFQSVQSIPRLGGVGGRKDFHETILGRSDLKEQEIVEQLQMLQASSGPVVHSSSINKLHSSQSYHQSNSKPELQHLQRKIDHYRQSLREKDLRITELQNTILDHFQSRSVVDPAPSTEQMRQKYEIYINNLKILLNEAKKENQVLRKEFIQSNEASLSRARPEHDCHSITLSDRTTKNPIAQTRMIQRRGRANNYQSIQAKLYLQDQIQQIFYALLQLYEKTGQLLEEDKLALSSSVLGCLRWLITDARAKGSRLQAETLQKEQVRRTLAQLGLQQL